jgi:hypothetical protein
MHLGRLVVPPGGLGAIGHQNKEIASAVLGDDDGSLREFIGSLLSARDDVVGGTSQPPTVGRVTDWEQDPHRIAGVASRTTSPPLSRWCRDSWPTDHLRGRAPVGLQVTLIKKCLPELASRRSTPCGQHRQELDESVSKSPTARSVKRGNRQVDDGPRVALEGIRRSTTA